MDGDLPFGESRAMEFLDELALNPGSELPPIPEEVEDEATRELTVGMDEIRGMEDESSIDGFPQDGIVCHCRLTFSDLPLK